MVSDEPTNGELARRLDGIGQSLRDLINRNEYVEYQRGVDHRYSEAQRDIEELRLRHERDDAALRAWISEELNKIHQKSQWKANLWVAIFPTIAAIASILVTIWLKKG